MELYLVVAACFVNCFYAFLPLVIHMVKWYDILPYKKDEDDINGIKALLDHVGNFVIVIHRGDSGEVGISIGARKEMSTAITMLDGMEVMVRDEFDFERYEKYRRYKHKRHCAIPISGRDADLESLYGILDREVSGLAFLAVNVKKTASMSRVYSYIRCMENGQSPGAMSAVMSMMSTPSKTKSISAMRQNRIQNAKTKIAQATHLFSCEIICGGTGTEDLQAIETVFPFDAFKSGRINGKKAKKLMAGNPSPPMFGGSTHPLLSEAELLSFLGFPSDEDLLKTNLRHGKTTSYTSGSRIADMDSTVGDMLKDIVKGDGAKPDEGDDVKESDGGDAADANKDDVDPNGNDAKDADNGSDADTNVDATVEPNSDSADTSWHSNCDEPIKLTEVSKDDCVATSDGDSADTSLDSNGDEPIELTEVSEDGGVDAAADADSVEPADAADGDHVNNDGRADDIKGNDGNGVETDSVDNGKPVDVGAGHGGEAVENADCGGDVCEDKAANAGADDNVPSEQDNDDSWDWNITEK